MCEIHVGDLHGRSFRIKFRAKSRRVNSSSSLGLGWPTWPGEAAPAWPSWWPGPQCPPLVRGGRTWWGSAAAGGVVVVVVELEVVEDPVVGEIGNVRPPVTKDSPGHWLRPVIYHDDHYLAGKFRAQKGANWRGNFDIWNSKSTKSLSNFVSFIIFIIFNLQYSANPWHGLYRFLNLNSMNNSKLSLTRIWQKDNAFINK